jgi:hypothetical protein
MQLHGAFRAPGVAQKAKPRHIVDRLGAFAEIARGRAAKRCRHLAERVDSLWAALQHTMGR